MAALLFGSGFCALVYQTTWFREFRLIFGASTAASAAVLAVFMGGLGLGGAVLGRRADRTVNGLRFYSSLEFGVAISAAATPLLLLLARTAYIASGGSTAFGLGGATAIRLFLTLLVLAIPTILMGGTLPAAARAVESGDDRGRRRLAVLYGTNTIGAVMGALAGTFGMLEAFGNRTTLWIAALLNITVAFAARRVSMRLEAEPAGATEIEQSEVPPAPRRRGFVFAAAAIVGFAFFLMEIVWYRMLSPLLGGSTYTFGLILAGALVGIGAGGLLYSMFGRSRVPTLRGFALTCAAEGLLIAAPYAIGDGIAILAILLRRLGAIGFEGYVAGWIVVAAIVVVPAAVVAGFQFPLLIGLLGEGRSNVGRDAGAAYAWNTIGAIAGSLAGGFGILPLLTAPGTWAFVVVLLVALAVAAILLAWKDEGARASLALPAAIGAGALACFAALGPTAVWRHSPIGAGRADDPEAGTTWRAWMQSQRGGIFWEEDGIESSVALTKGAGLAFLVSGKSDGHFRSDAGTQVMAGLIGAAVHPNPKRAFVIGLGTGSTAGWLARIPSMDRVDVAELEPGILHVAELAGPVNASAMRNPRLAVHLGDAREMLLTSKQRYDLIVSEPSNPYRAGVASLFTRDFYEAVEERLGRDGVFVQWVQSYEIETGTIRTVYATLAAVFDHVESWQSQAGDLILLASNAPRSYDADRLRRVVSTEPYRTAMHAAWRSESLEGLLARYLADERFTKTLLDRTANPINTDDRNFIEFQAARSVGKRTSFQIADLRAAAAGTEMHRPRISGRVDWERVDQERLGVYSSNGGAPPPPPGASPSLEGRARAHSEWVRGRLAAAVREWKACCGQPVNSLETALVAEVAADDMEPPADAWLDRLARENRVEAALIRARLRWRQQRVDEAAALLVEGFEGYRKDPWPLSQIVARSFTIAELAAAERPDLAPRIYDSLSTPFAIYSLDYQRRTTALLIARRLEKGCGPRVLQSLRGFEPWAPWEKPILQLRAQCYEAAGDPRARTAKRELAELLADEPESLLE